MAANHEKKAVKHKAIFTAQTNSNMNKTMIMACVTNDKLFLIRSCDMCQLVKPFLVKA